MNTSIMTNNLFITMLIIGAAVFLAAVFLTIVSRQSDSIVDVLGVGGIILLVYSIISIVAYAGLGSVARRDACRTKAATLVLKEVPDMTPSDLALSISKICK